MVINSNSEDTACDGCPCEDSSHCSNATISYSLLSCECVEDTSISVDCPSVCPAKEHVCLVCGPSNEVCEVSSSHCRFGNTCESCNAAE